MFARGSPYRIRLLCSQLRPVAGHLAGLLGPCDAVALAVVEEPQLPVEEWPSDMPQQSAVRPRGVVPAEAF
jgi:hypothetical protein